MSTICIEFSAFFHKKEDAIKAKMFLSKWKVNYSLLGYVFCIEPIITIKRRIIPSNKDVEYLATLTFIFVFPGVFRISENAFFSPEALEYEKLRKKWLSTKISELKTSEELEAYIDLSNKYFQESRNIIMPDFLDDFYVNEAIPFISSLVLAAKISNPKLPLKGCPVRLYIDSKIYKNEFLIEYPIIEDAYSGSYFDKKEDAVIPIQMAWDWIFNYAIQLDERKKEIPNIFSAFTYLFRRTDKECLIFSVIGLESIYAPKKYKQREQLKKNIKKLFTDYVQLYDDVDEIYTMRSKFLHGELEFTNSYLDRSDFRDYYKYEPAAIKASLLVLATIRCLICNNAISISFSEDSYTYTHPLEI